MNSALPACAASRVQIPAAMRVTVLPLIVQIVGVVVAKVTANPDDALALTVKSSSPSV